MLFARQDHVHPTDTSRVAKAGDTMTGDLFATGTAEFTVNRALGADALIRGMKGLKSRWSVALGNFETESGSNLGSNFTIYRYDDAGGFLGGSLSIARNNGDITVVANAYKPSGGPWAATSDERIKDVVGDYTHGLAEVLQLAPVRYTFKGNYSKMPDGPSAHQQLALEKREFVGLIAQQAEVPMPEMVTVEAGYINDQPVTDLRVLDTTALMFALVNACKELAARIETLEGAAGVKPMPAT
jgi:Chaperone of endosialidase